MSRAGTNRKPANDALMKLRWAFIGVAILSAFLSLLMLTGSIYMMQVYDRVLASRSIPTLIGISAIVLVAFVIQGILDAVRTRMLSRIGAEFDREIAPTLFELARTLPLRGARPEQSMQGVRDLDTVRTFLGGLGPTALFDMPFAIVFCIAGYLLHPWLGWMTVIGAFVIVALTLWTERRTKDETMKATQIAAERQVLLDSSRRNAEAIQAMGMGSTFRNRWDDVHGRFVGSNLAVGDAAGGLGSAAKVFRMAFQSAVLGLGAYLVILQQLSPGAMIAASILTSRALAPIETAIANWKGFVAARQSFARMNEMLLLKGLETERTVLPSPERDFAATDLAVTVPGRSTPLLLGGTFALKAGQALMITGPSGGGKSTFVRVLAGVWPAMRGAVRLDGAAIEHWDREQLGRHMGYLPQDIELFDGTISQNIGRFRPDLTDDMVVAAARAAGAHDMILKLPEGYETRIGEGGMTLSGGQRQRVGIARALFGDPFLVILDEPNSNLDADGEAALLTSINEIKQRGGIVVIVSHKLPVLQVVDFVGRVADGKLIVITAQEYRQNMTRAAQAGQMQRRPAAAQASPPVTMLRASAAAAPVAVQAEDEDQK